METLSLGGQETRAAAYAAPGWDKEESDTDSENDDNLVCDEINLEFYSRSIHLKTCKMLILN